MQLPIKWTRKILKNHSHTSLLKTANIHIISGSCSSYLLSAAQLFALTKNQITLFPRRLQRRSHHQTFVNVQESHNTPDKVHVQIDKHLPMLAISLFEKTLKLPPKRGLMIMMLQRQPLPLSPTRLSTVRNLHLVDQQVLPNVHNRHSQPLNARRYLHPVPILKPLPLKLNIIFDYKNVTLCHLIKEAQPRKIIRLVTSTNQGNSLPKNFQRVSTNLTTSKASAFPKPTWLPRKEAKLTIDS